MNSWEVAHPEYREQFAAARRLRGETAALMAASVSAGIRNLWSAARDAATGIATTLAREAERRAGIRQLQALDDRMLKDIGIARAAIPGAVDEALDGWTGGDSVEPAPSAARRTRPAAPAAGANDNLDVAA